MSALHGTDDFVAGAELMGLSASRLRAQERTAVLNADVVTALSPLLAERWSALRGAPVQLIPNGCTPVRPGARRVPEVNIDLPKPVVGLIGRLNARIDMDLVEAVADAGYSLLIVGPHDPQWEPRRRAGHTTRPRVHCVGRVPEEDASAYAAAADIGITPYLDSPFNRASFPLKTLDYLSASRPAVSTDLAAARWLLDDLTRSERASACRPLILALAGNCADFVDAVRHIVGDPENPDWGEPAARAVARQVSSRRSNAGPSPRDIPGPAAPINTWLPPWASACLLSVPARLPLPDESHWAWPGSCLC